MQKIGAFKLRNNGGFVCAPAANWIDDNGNTQRTGTGSSIPLGQETMFNPGEYGVSDGTPVELYISITLGSDRTGGTYYTFGASSNQYAEYDITGTTLDSDVHFDGIKTN